MFYQSAEESGANVEIYYEVKLRVIPQPNGTFLASVMWGVIPESGGEADYYLCAGCSKPYATRRDARQALGFFAAHYAHSEMTVDDFAQLAAQGWETP